MFCSFPFLEGKNVELIFNMEGGQCHLQRHVRMTVSPSTTRREDSGKILSPYHWKLMVPRSPPVIAKTSTSFLVINYVFPLLQIFIFMNIHYCVKLSTGLFIT